MPLFQYRAQDNQGRTVEGMVTADDAQAATQNLVTRGFRIFDLTQKGAATASAPAAPRPQAPAPHPQPQVINNVGANPSARNVPPPSFGPTPARRSNAQREQINLNAPIAKPTIAPAGPQRVNIPVAQPVNIVRTQRGTDKANTFLFAQLASFFRAGVNPAEAFATLARNNPKPWYQQSLLDASKATSEGVRFSQVLERYPDLYPPHIVGMIRAGEEGGFLVEATEAVAEQTSESMKFNVWPKILFWWIFGNIIFLPPTISLMSAVDHLTDEYLGSHPSSDQNGLGMLGHAFVKSTIWPVGPMTIAITLATWLGYRWWMQLNQQMLRHKAVLKVPTIGKRARNESLATFGWALSMVSRAGVAPRSAWLLAAGSMPNLWMADRMKTVGNQMHDGTKLSQALGDSQVVPVEFSSIVSNGELVGDVPSSLMLISSASREEFTREDALSKGRIGCWGFLVVAFVMLASGILMAHYYGHIMQVFTTSE